MLPWYLASALAAPPMCDASWVAPIFASSAPGLEVSREGRWVKERITLDGVTVTREVSGCTPHVESFRWYPVPVATGSADNLASIATRLRALPVTQGARTVRDLLVAATSGPCTVTPPDGVGTTVSCAPALCGKEACSFSWHAGEDDAGALVATWYR